jgi:hypothetical protein
MDTIADVFRGTLIALGESKCDVPIVLAHGRAAWRRRRRVVGLDEARSALVAALLALADGDHLVRVDAALDQLVSEDVRAIERRGLRVLLVGLREALDHHLSLRHLDRAGHPGDLRLGARRRAGRGAAVALGVCGRLGGGAHAAGSTGPGAVSVSHRAGRGRGLRRRGLVVRLLLRCVVHRDDHRVVAEVAEHALLLVEVALPAVRRAARGRRDREEIIGLQRFALHHPNRLQIEAERERRARADAELHVLPVLARGVVDDGPRLERDLPVVLHRHAVARLPRRRLGHVRQPQEASLRSGRDPDLHVDEPARSHRGALRRVRDGRGFAGLRVDDGERFQEVVDLVTGNLERELVALHLGGALEVRDSVSVDDDATEGRVGVDERGHPAAAPHEHGGGEDDGSDGHQGQGGELSHGGTFDQERPVHLGRIKTREVSGRGLKTGAT